MCCLRRESGIEGQMDLVETLSGFTQQGVPSLPGKLLKRVEMALTGRWYQSQPKSFTGSICTVLARFNQAATRALDGRFY
jgi:hypothetical protein